MKMFFWFALTLLGIYTVCRAISQFRSLRLKLQIIKILKKSETPLSQLVVKQRLEVTFGDVTWHELQTALEQLKHREDIIDIEDPENHGSLVYHLVKS